MKSLTESLFKRGVYPYLDSSSVLGWSKTNRRALRFWRSVEPAFWEHLDYIERSREIWLPNDSTEPRMRYRRWKVEAAARRAVFTPKRSWSSFLWSTPHPKNILFVGKGQSVIGQLLLRATSSANDTIRLGVLGSSNVAFRLSQPRHPKPNYTRITMGKHLTLVCYYSDDQAILKKLSTLPPRATSLFGLVRVVQKLEPHQPTSDETNFMLNHHTLWIVSVTENGEGLHHLAYRIAIDIPLLYSNLH